MQALIFISLSLIIILFVIYLGVSAVQKGLKSKKGIGEIKEDLLEDDTLIRNNISFFSALYLDFKSIKLSLL